MNPRGRPVRITWLDSNGFSHGGWTAHTDVKCLDVATCVSYGEVIFEDEREVRIVPHIQCEKEADGHTYLGAMVIPRVCIERIDEAIFTARQIPIIPAPVPPVNTRQENNG